VLTPGTDEHRVTRAALKFAGCGETEKTRLFSHFDAKVQEQLLEQMELESGELPCFAHFENGAHWLVATSRRFIWRRDITKTAMHYTEMKSFGSSTGPDAPTQRKSIENADLRMNVDGEWVLTKLRTPWFFIYDFSGIRHEILVEPIGLLSIWNGLLSMVRLRMTPIKSGD
jgi:hypothetical protein